MAVCRYCLGEMLDRDVTACTGNTHVAFGDGTRLPSVPWTPGPGDPGGRCPDCNVAANGTHHPGCDRERCPQCGGQLISCGCI